MTNHYKEMATIILNNYADSYSLADEEQLAEFIEVNMALVFKDFEDWLFAKKATASKQRFENSHREDSMNYFLGKRCAFHEALEKLKEMNKGM